jgi:hypothetical protein
VVDLGFRGVDRDNPQVEIIHRGKYKSLTKQQRRWLKRRQAVEPAIGHLKSDHRMDRCWLQGELGDALHAVLCATGYNLRWLLRATRVRQLLTQVHEFIRGCFKKCHYSKVSCSGSRGFVRFKAAKMLACSVLVVDSPVLG